MAHPDHDYNLFRFDEEDRLDDSEDGDTDVDEQIDDQLWPDDIETREYEYLSEVNVDEDRHHEFKAVQRAANPMDAISEFCGKYVNAFLNTEGGTLYLGIEDNGKAVGIPLSRKQRDEVRLRVDSVINRFRPQVDPRLYRIKFVLVHISKKSVRKLAKEEREIGIERGKMSSKKKKNPNFNDSVGYIDDKTEGITRFVIEVEVRKGSAPLYFVSEANHNAYIRRDGSVALMDPEMIKTRVSGVYRRLLVRRPSRIPVLHDDFTGRQNELAAIREFVHGRNENCKIIALHGSPGVGKSWMAYRLAVEMSDGYPSSIFVDVRSTTPMSEFRDRGSNFDNFARSRSNSELSTSAASNLGYSYGSTNYETCDNSEFAVVRDEIIMKAMKLVVSSRLPNVNVEEKSLPQLRAHYFSCFADKRMILLIENAASAAFVLPLLPLSSEVLVIVTSRRDLGLQSFARAAVLSIRLGELSPRDSVVLLMLSVNHKREVTEGEAIEICRLCGHLPQPIRLVGALLAKRTNITVQAIIQQLSGADDTALRDIGRGANIEEALDLLEPHLLHALRLLSIFPYPFDAAAASAVLGIATGISDCELILSDLIDDSMLWFDEGSRLYWQNDFLRNVVSSKANAIDGFSIEIANCRRRFVMHYLELLECIVEDGQRDSSSGRYAQDFYNFETAYRYAQDLNLNWEKERLVALTESVVASTHSISMPLSSSLNSYSVDYRGNLNFSSSSPVCSAPSSGVQLLNANIEKTAGLSLTEKNDTLLHGIPMSGTPKQSSRPSSFDTTADEILGVGLPTLRIGPSGMGPIGFE